MALDARFCFSCGQALPLPALPAGVDGKVRAAANLGEVAAAAAGAAVEPAAAAADSRPQPKKMEAAGGYQAARSGARAARPPRPHEVHKFTKLTAQEPQQPLSWNQKEKRVAEWMGNIKPRQH